MVVMRVMLTTTTTTTTMMMVMMRMRVRMRVVTRIIPTIKLYVCLAGEGETGREAGSQKKQ